MQENSELKPAHLFQDNWEYINCQNDTLESDSEDSSKPPMHEFIRNWALEFNITGHAVSALMKGLQEYGCDLPDDSRGLLKTPKPRTISISKLSGGDYTYFGVQSGLNDVLRSVNTDFDSITISIHIDGLATFKSKNMTVWPIQATVENIVEISNVPFIIGLYSGGIKPTNTDYLNDLVNELCRLQSEGYNGKPLNISNVICDAPARSHVKGIFQFNGTYGCDFCEIKGQFDGTMLFLEKGNPRTNESFRLQTNSRHHKTESPFLRLNIDMIKQFPLDPMHGIDLGVVKRLLLLWKEGPLPFRLSSTQVKTMNLFIKNIRNCIPPAFNRKPRSMDELKLWKATEFRTFVMYTGIILLREILDRKKYIHFLSLCVAVRIMYNDLLLEEHKDYAEHLLLYFVNKVKVMYGNRFVVYNVHSLLHICQIAVDNRSLQRVTAYRFENNMSKIRSWIRGTGNPIIQISNRLMEHRAVPSIIQAPRKTVLQPGLCYEIDNHKFCLLHEIGLNSSLCEIFVETVSLFSEPCDSRIAFIFKGFKSNTQIKTIENSNITKPLQLFEEYL